MLLEQISRATEKLFDERKDFVVIGLTGRTGSGCSTVAKLLTQDFGTLNPPKPKENDFNSNEERKYQIIYRYAKQNWSGFKLIEIRDIITSFLLEYDFNAFILYVKQLAESIKDIEKLVEKLTGEIREKFERLHNLRQGIKKEVGQDENVLDSDDIYSFYFQEIPRFSVKLKDIMNAHQANLYPFLFQKFGNNIRTSGKVYDDEFNPENIFILSQRTNKLIKVLRKRNLKEKGRVLVVIDALRNPYEVTFFKDRYSTFYLFSVNTEDQIRVKRLIDNGLTLPQIKNLDEREYPERQLGVSKFSSQNIQKCIELADVHLYSPTNDVNVLKTQLIKYVSLIMHPGLVTPTHVERCMQIAVNAKLNSGCLSRQVGAVVTGHDYSVKAVGWNNAPEGQISCNLRSLNSLLGKDDIDAFSDFEINNDEFHKFLSSQVEGMIDDNKLQGRILSYCFKDAYNVYENKKNQVHTRSLHAEENAFLQIAKYGGEGIKGGYLFTTASPCELCSKKAYQLGIKKIYYVDPYPGISESHVLHCGSRRPELELYRGAIGEAYHALYTPIIPVKDELYMLLGFNFKRKN